MTTSISKEQYNGFAHKQPEWSKNKYNKKNLLTIVRHERRYALRSALPQQTPRTHLLSALRAGQLCGEQHSTAYSVCKPHNDRQGTRSQGDAADSCGYLKKRREYVWTSRAGDEAQSERERRRATVYVMYAWTNRQ